MKIQRTPFLSIAYSICSLFLYYKLLTTGNIVLFCFASFILSSPFIASFFIRKHHWAEPYFTNPYNFFTEKVRFSKEYDMPKNLLLEKITEIINESEFKIINIDDESYKIAAIGSLSHNTFGENLYISLSEKEKNTNMNICCTTIHAVSSWGRNRKNINNLIQQMEESLII